MESLEILWELNTPFAGLTRLSGEEHSASGSWTLTVGSRSHQWSERDATSPWCHWRVDHHDDEGRH